MSKLVVTVTDKQTTKDLVFNIYDTVIAKKWKEEVEKNYPIQERNRFQGWPNNKKTIKYFQTELKNRIDVVNNYNSNTITCTNIDTQEDLNFLHTFFENLRGRTDFYNNAPDKVKTAIDDFNRLIHECEHEMRDTDSPTLIVTYGGKPRLKLLKEDFENFTFQWKYGEVYINYCEVGKPLLDIFKDKDKVVGDEGVRPQSLYSADFMIKFGPSVPDDFYKNRLNEFNEWYEAQNYNFKHKALGMIPVAMLEQGEPYPNYTEVESVCIK